MITLNGFDSKAPFLAQLAEPGDEPVILVNTFVAPEGQMESLYDAWRLDAGVMKTKPGLISAQLHRGAGNSRVMMNMAVWESTKALQEGFVNPDFQKFLATYPDGSVAYPHLVRPVAVPGICLGEPWESAVAGGREPGDSAGPAIEFLELCPELPVANQLATIDRDFVLLDVLIAPEGAAEQAIAAYQQVASYMKKRPGFIQAQLYRGIGGSGVLINLAVWESGKDLLAAVADPAFAQVVSGYPAGSRCTRHVLHRVAVPGLCVA
ncbi:antibiotic biosynthesis monooxygenase family protein [Nocardia pseudovaccinii]|uniref:antibiotic biosynthesis monooxygenase family protein n=1 Tax=Nocardia pseudovaccinii TaxID=189540 RepID=UPI0007A3AD56|nr:antibiotic biosynthesis monooxygenase family protein [Nocardia pseudovaccinii]